MLGGDRLDRVNALLRRELSTLVARELEFPSGTLVTVTKVTTSPDLEHAKVYVSILPPERTAEVIEPLDKSTATIQRLLNRALVMEFVPRIRFVVDDGENRAARIERLLDTLDR